MVPEKDPQPNQRPGENVSQMTVEIVCPNCHFSKRVPRENIPARARWANCPSCGYRFKVSGRGIGGIPFRLGPEAEPAHDGPPLPFSGQDLPEQSFWSGLYGSFKSVLFSPRSFFQSMPAAGGIGEPLAFGLFFGSLGAMFGWSWKFLLLWENFNPFGEYFMGPFTLEIFFIGVLILSPLLVILEIFFSSCILHVTLMIVGGAGGGFDATFKVMAYSQASQVFGLIPFLGGVIGWFWQLVIRIIGLKKIHQTTYLKIVLAFLLPLGAVILTAIGIMAFALS